MSRSIKAESWDPAILDRGYVIRNGKKIYVRKIEPRSDEFKRSLESLSGELKRRMGRLSPMQRKCIELYYLSGKFVTQERIAKRLKISRATVKEHLRRAIEKLKEG